VLQQGCKRSFRKKDKQPRNCIIYMDTASSSKIQTFGRWRRPQLKQKFKDWRPALHDTFKQTCDLCRGHEGNNSYLENMGWGISVSRDGVCDCERFRVFPFVGVGFLYSEGEPSRQQDTTTGGAELRPRVQ